MTSVSQQNLLKLAQEDEEKGQIGNAIQILEEALSYGNSDEVVVKLCQLYRKNKQGDQAYTLIKEEPDLFSEPKIFDEYCKILESNHFLIEALQLKHLLKKDLPVLVKPVSTEEQDKIIASFRRQEQVSQFDYQSLLKLDLIKFTSFAQSLLLDPSQNFAVRLALCEDLIRLGFDEPITVWVLGEQKDFVPDHTVLLEKSTVYQEVVSGMGDHFRKNPSQLPLMLGETNLILGSLYPFLSTYIRDTDSFTSDLISYIEKHDGRLHQELLDKIYTHLPK